MKLGSRGRPAPQRSFKDGGRRAQGLAESGTCSADGAAPTLEPDRDPWIPVPAETKAVAGNSPVYGPGWEFPLVVAQGVAGKPGLFLPGRTVYFCHSSQG